jgi:hypothetical protein
MEEKGYNDAYGITLSEKQEKTSIYELENLRNELTKNEEFMKKYSVNNNKNN